MHTCSIKEMREYVFSCGLEYTTDIFIIEGNVYIRTLETKQYVIKHPGNVVVLKTSTKDVYLCWSYITHVRRYVDSSTFWTQYRFFDYVKRHHSDYKEKMLDAILDNDLFTLAIKSEHLF